MLYINNVIVGILLINGTDEELKDNNIYQEFHGNISAILVRSTSKQKISVLSTLSEWNIAKANNGKSVTFSGGYSGTGVLSIKSNQSDGVYVKWSGEVI
jgi:hypothetical protein